MFRRDNSSDKEDYGYVGRYGRWGGILIFLAIIIIFSFFMSPSDPVEFNFEEDYFTATVESGYTCTVYLSDINSIEVRDGELDLGVMLDGIDGSEEKSGIWENSEFGQYTICIAPDIERYIVIDTVNGIVVVNYADESSTESLAEAIEELLE